VAVIEIDFSKSNMGIDANFLWTTPPTLTLPTLTLLSTAKLRGANVDRAVVRYRPVPVQTNLRALY